MGFVALLLPPLRAERFEAARPRSLRLRRRVSGPVVVFERERLVVGLLLLAEGGPGFLVWARREVMASERASRSDLRRTWADDLSGFEGEIGGAVGELGERSFNGSGRKRVSSLDEMLLCFEGDGALCSGVAHLGGSSSSANGPWLTLGSFLDSVEPCLLPLSISLLLSGAGLVSGSLPAVTSAALEASCDFSTSDRC